MRSLMLALAFVLSLGAPLRRTGAEAAAPRRPRRPRLTRRQPGAAAAAAGRLLHVQPRGPPRPVRVAAGGQDAANVAAGTPDPKAWAWRASATDEISVRGVLQSAGGYVAMVQGPDNKTYLVRQNDKLLDGMIKAITAQGLVILQEVNDPLSLVKQKEVRKMLHGNEEGK